MTATRSAERCWAVVPAAGRGERFGAADIPAQRKQYASLAGRSVIEHALRPLINEPRIAGIVVAIAGDDAHWPVIAARLAREFPGAPEIMVCTGGPDRQVSVLNGLAALNGRASPRDWVLVHDAARPCLDAGDLARLLDALPDSQGALLALPVADTLKSSDDRGGLRTVDRDGMWRALTPQAFRHGDLTAALSRARAENLVVTDEAQAMEMAGFSPRLVEGGPGNIKVTREQDMRVAERFLRLSGGGAMRIGQGIDVHAFTAGDHVMLGGVRIGHSRGIDAHSDGDVIIHALCDALLGALGQGDIGRHFPDTEARWRGADSRLFLRHVAALMQKARLRLVNADVTVTAQAPRLAAHVPAMVLNLASDLGADAACINVKATTTERLGFIGREEGLAAMAVVLLDALDP